MVVDHAHNNFSATCTYFTELCRIVQNNTEVDKETTRKNFIIQRLFNLCRRFFELLLLEIF